MSILDKQKRNIVHRRIDYFREFRKNFPKEIDWRTYRDITRNFNKHLLDKLINGDRIYIPYRLGYIEIISIENDLVENIQRKSKMVDWGRTMEFWEDCPEMKEKKKIVLRENLIAYFSWKINKCYLNNKEFYKFVPYDRYRRKLSSVLKKDIKEYRIIKI